MVFKTVSTRSKVQDDIATEVYELAEEKMIGEKLIIPESRKPWRASDIKAECPRQVYYSRHERKAGSARRVGAAALFGTVTHAMFQLGAPDDYSLWEYLWENETGVSLHSDLIDWQSQAKPFSLSAFRDAPPEAKVEALYDRYLGLDRPNYLEFWERKPYAIYRHPPTGRLAQEQTLRGKIDGEAIRTTADVLFTDLYTAEIVAGDWKTGRASEFTQLATYAIIAEQQFDLEPGSIERGMFILSGSGECFAPRGKLPTHYEPDPDNMIVEDNLEPWREVVSDRIQRLVRREETGVWRPKFNPLCYRACEYRYKCPIGQAVAEIREKSNE